MTSPARAAPRRGEAERGQVTAFVTIFVVALLFVTGLVLDGGLLLAAKREADATASAAARAGAQAVSLDALRTSGEQRLDEAASRQAVAEFLSRAGHRGRVIEVAGDHVSVEVTIDKRLLILGIGNLTSRTVKGQATARNVRGVREAET